MLIGRVAQIEITNQPNMADIVKCPEGCFVPDEIGVVIDVEEFSS
jgi:hypothetical protein